MDWALAQAKTKQPVVSGFHSPLEQSVLNLLLQAQCPVVLVLARSLAGARLDSAWQAALAERNMAIISLHTAGGRLTKTLAVERNDVAALLATRIVIAHAEPNGQLADAKSGWESSGVLIESL
jgi:predicted Rossmann fold nucleotide-binding protein DprA/Smf involved in DNA uptake